MSIEIIVYIVLSCLLSSLRRVISGMKNGCYYAKDKPPYPSKLKMYIENIHFLETPAWYCQFGSLFFSIFAILRLMNPSYEALAILIEIGVAFLFVMGSSAVASYYFQWFINYGSGIKEEDKKSEFALKIFGKKILFNWFRPWYGNGRRKLVMAFGFVQITVAVILTIYLL